MIKRILLCAFVAIGLTYGQSGALSWSIYQTILTNSTTPAPFTSFVFRNVGQTTHEVVGTLLPNPTQLCVGPIVGTLQASYDGVTYFNFGSTINSTPTGGGTPTFLFVGTGAYPRVKFGLTSYNNATCNISLSYSGATTNPFTQILGASANGTSSTGLSPVVIGGTGNGNVVAPVAACDNTQGGTITAGAGPTVIASGGQVKICDIVIDPTAGGTATVQIQAGGAPTCTVSGRILLTLTFAANSPPFINGSGLGAVITGIPSEQICLSATGSNVNYMISFITI